MITGFSFANTCLKRHNYQYKMARVICIANSKGGVGKTTTAVNLGAYLARLGRRVLLIDFDPQANASSALGHRFNDESKNIYHAVTGSAEVDGELVRQSDFWNYHFIPSHPNLAGLLVELVAHPDREYLLRRFINKIRHHYDYIVIDSPPSLSLLTINGLVASDEVLVPVQAEYYSLEGLTQLLDTIEMIRGNLKHDLKIAGAVITMHDKRERLSREISGNLRKHFPAHVFDVEIPRAVSLAEAPSFGKTILGHEPGSAGALAYERLAREVIAFEDRYKAPEDFGDFNNLV